MEIGFIQSELVTVYEPELGVFPIYENVKIPYYATLNSACFDLSAYLGPEIVCVDTYNRILNHTKRSIGPLPSQNGKRGTYIEPGECVFVPTGLIFDIPNKYQMLIFPRSGLSAKYHQKLANCVAVIDEDYVEQTYILLFNDSEMRQDIVHGERIAQAQLQPIQQCLFDVLLEPPKAKTDRKGGMGHTGR